MHTLWSFFSCPHGPGMRGPKRVAAFIPSLPQASWPSTKSLQPQQHQGQYSCPHAPGTRDPRRVGAFIPSLPPPCAAALEQQRVGGFVNTEPPGAPRVSKQGAGLNPSTPPYSYSTTANPFPRNPKPQIYPHRHILENHDSIEKLQFF